VSRSGLTLSPRYAWLGTAVDRCFAGAISSRIRSRCQAGHSSQEFYLDDNCRIVLLFARRMCIPALAELQLNARFCKSADLRTEWFLSPHFRAPCAISPRVPPAMWVLDLSTRQAPMAGSTSGLPKTRRLVPSKQTGFPDLLGIIYCQVQRGNRRAETAALSAVTNQHQRRMVRDFNRR